LERILVIGCSGSGKSTLSRTLGEKLRMNVVHLDQLWWQEGWQHVTREEFDEKLDTELKKERWIMDGNFSRTIPQRISRCDTIVYLDFNRFTCLWGLLQRYLGWYGKTRPDMGPNCPEKFDFSFVRWIWNFNKNNRVRNYTWLAQAKHAKTIVLKNRRQVKRFLAGLEA
jgi:adenylate kinase family enzyme